MSDTSVFPKIKKIPSYQSFAPVNPNELSDQEAYVFLEKLFPDGLKDPSLIAELCPGGWEKSPLFACYHPAPEVLYQEYLDVSRNFKTLFSRIQSKAENAERLPPEEPELTFEEFFAKYPADNDHVSADAAINEPAMLLGLCLWDVFSNNHEVITDDSRTVDLGSFRGCAGMISDFFEGSSRDEDDVENWRDTRGMGYMDFYMGSSQVRSRADLTPVYQLIFRRLKAVGADWRYSFPQIHIVDFSSREPDSDTPYDPSSALEQEAERIARAEKIANTRQNIERNAQRAKRKARTDPLPATVGAYQGIYGKFPPGWPPDPYTTDSGSSD